MMIQHAKGRSPSTRKGFVFTRRGNERGIAVITVAMFLVALFGFAALVVDLGMLLTARSELQNGADAGALAGLAEYVMYGQDEGEQTAKTYATNPNNYHIVGPVPGTDAVDVSIPGPETMQVRVARATGTASGAMPTIFAHIWGIQTADVSALAVATLDRRIIGTGPGNLLPFGVNKNMADADNNGSYDLGSVIDIFPHPWASGDFGLLDLDGGDNSNADIIRWIENGFDGFFIIPQGAGNLEVEGSPHMNIEGKPGVVGNSIADAVYSRVGDLVLLPIFDQVSGHGANALYRVIDFVGVYIVNAQLTQAMGLRYLNVKITQFSAPNLVAGDGGTPTNNSVSTPVLIR